MPVHSLRGGWLVLGLVTAALGCRREEGSENRKEASFARGDSVVVEGPAAEFFQARVLEVDGEVLRVQSATGDPITVARGDAYRLPSSPVSPVSSKTGDLGICRVDGARWVACKIVRFAGNAVVAVDPSGHPLEVPRGAVLNPTAVTRLNLARRFERANQRAAFLLAWKRAGEPKSPTGWSPEPGERVVAKHTLGWFSARVEQAADGGVLLRSESDRAEIVAGDAARVPLPPYDHVFKTGEFALLEPKLAPERWKPVRIERVSPDGVTVTDEDGLRTEVPPRKLLPVSPP